MSDKAVRRSAGRTTEPSDQSIELAAILVVEAPEIGHDTMPRLARFVAEGLDDLKIASPSTLVDAHEHAYKLVKKAH